MAIHDLSLTSPDIASGARIDDRFAGEHGSTTPTMIVSGVPEGTVELALICHDPDAPMPPGFTHWTLYGLAPRDGELVPDDGRSGPHDANGVGYVGPFPPPGHGDHHYFFWVYALSRAVTGEPTRQEFLDQYADAVIGQARIVGTYSR
jgi:hypothetical protein